MIIENLEIINNIKRIHILKVISNNSNRLRINLNSNQKMIKLKDTKD